MGKLVYILLLFLCACSSKEVIYVINEGKASLDSILLVRQDSLVRLNIGTRLTPTPLCSQVKDSLYIMLDENALHFFNLNNGCFLRTLPIKECGMLNNYSGFLYKSQDSIFVYNYKLKTVFFLGEGMEVRKKWNVRESCRAKYPIDPETLTNSPLLYSRDRVILSGVELGQPDDVGADDRPTTCCITLGNDGMAFGGIFPICYEKGNFGGVYYNKVYHSLNQDGNLLLSFLADHNIYCYSLDFKDCKKIYMGSRYIQEIASSGDNALDLFKDKQRRIAYYTEQPSYGNILYDSYRHLYYRVAQIPLQGWTDGNFRKPFSIITMDSLYQIISETPVVTDYAELNLGNMHVVKDGLLIQKNNKENEDVIEFVLYKINKCRKE